MLDQTRLTRFQESQDYRASYIASRVRLAVASQIHVLREQFSGTQTDFAGKIGKPQSVISRLENPDYGKMSIQTLLDIAKALDIAMVVKFVSYDRFFTLLNDAQITPDALRVDPFAETVRRHQQISVTDNVISLGLLNKMHDPIAGGSPKEDPWHETPKAVLDKATEPKEQPNQPLYGRLNENTKKSRAV